jgi:hypothetical protein
MLSYKDKIITFPLFNTCYPQNLARNLARFSQVIYMNGKNNKSEYMTIEFVYSNTFD